MSGAPHHDASVLMTTPGPAAFGQMHGASSALLGPGPFPATPTGVSPPPPLGTAGAQPTTPSRGRSDMMRGGGVMIAEKEADEMEERMRRWLREENGGGDSVRRRRSRSRERTRDAGVLRRRSRSRSRERMMRERRRRSSRSRSRERRDTEELRIKRQHADLVKEQLEKELEEKRLEEVKKRRTEVHIISIFIPSPTTLVRNREQNIKPSDFV